MKKKLCYSLHYYPEVTMVVVVVVIVGGGGGGGGGGSGGGGGRRGGEVGELFLRNLMKLYLNIENIAVFCNVAALLFCVQPPP